VVCSQSEDSLIRSVGVKAFSQRKLSTNDANLLWFRAK